MAFCGRRLALGGWGGSYLRLEGSGDGGGGGGGGGVFGCYGVGNGGGGGTARDGGRMRGVLLWRDGGLWDWYV